MKLIMAFDDLHARDGRKVLAARTVSVGVDGQWFDLDLTEENIAALAEVLDPYIAVAEKRSTPPPVKRKANSVSVAEADDKIPMFKNVLLKHAVGISRIKYYAEARAWLESEGITVPKPDGVNYRYQEDWLSRYEKHLDEHGGQAGRALAQAS